MKTFKKALCIVLVLISILSLSACGSKEGQYYNNTVFESLKSFTAISSSEPASVVEDFASETIYKYLLREKADKYISKYNDYLIKYGFTVDSDADSEDITYKFEDYELIFSSSETDNGIFVQIIIPCDEATINSRNKAIYTELETAFNNKEYEEVVDISTRLCGEYENSDYYINFATGMKYYDMGIWALAYESLQSFSDNAEAKACIKEITSYNGIYKCSEKYVDKYILIKNGEVAKETGSIYSPSSYKVGDPVFYIDELINTTIPSGEKQLIIGSHYSDKDKYDYAFLELSDGSFLSAKDETNPYDTFSGIYKKISNTPPADKYN